MAVAQTTAFTKAYGLAAYLKARGLSNAESGQVYTEYTFRVKQGNASGHVNPGQEYLEQVVYCKGATSTLITAIDAFIAAPLSSPAAYNL